MTTRWTILAHTLYNAVAAVEYGVYAAVYSGFALATEAWLVWPLFAIYGLFPALTEAIAKALAVDTAVAEGRGMTTGVYLPRRDYDQKHDAGPAADHWHAHRLWQERIRGQSGSHIYG